MADVELSDRQQQLVHYLPASAASLADSIGVSPSTVKDHIAAIREKGISLPFDRENNVYYLKDEPKVRRVSTKHTGNKTREANNYITEVERTILRRLGDTDVIAPQTPSPGNEDMVVFLTDLHIGDKVEDQTGAVVYDSEKAEQVVDTVTSQALKLKETMGGVASFDTLHLVYGGDVVTNENIYDGQAFDIESMLADQMTTGVRAMTRQIKSFAEAFETVNVICQPGNHGKTRASGVSKQANMDLVSYRWVKDRLIESDIQNVNMRISEATWYMTFPLRGGEWRGFVTHGQDSHQHVDSTAASKGRWRGWLNEYQFDVAFRGHYHESRIENVQNGPLVVESPSPKPSDEWVSRIGQGAVETDRPQRLAFACGTSDERPMTWSCWLDDKE